MKGRLKKNFIRLLLPLGFSSLLLVMLLCGLAQAIEAEPRVPCAATSRERNRPSLLDYQTGVSVCEQTENPVLNPGFEEGSGEPRGPDHWNECGACLFWYDDPGPDSDFSAGISASSPRGEHCRLISITPFDAVPVEAGKSYDYSAWVQANLTQGDAYLRITFLSWQEDHWEYEGEARTTSVVDTQWAWVKVTGSVQAPADAEYARAEAVLPGSSLGSVWFDDIFFGLAICLDISKSDDPDPVSPGQILTYTIVYSNTGREKATDVWVIETYDDCVDFERVQPPPDIGDSYWEIGDLSPGASGTITVVVQVADDTEECAWLFNKVQICSDETVECVYTIISTVITNGDGCAIALYIPDAEKSGEPGYPMNYDLTLCNVGACDGRADLVATSSQGWEVVITPALPYTLPSGSCNDVTMSLVVPQHAAGGTVDVTFITATLVCGPPCNETAVETAIVTTTVMHPVFLPIVANDFWSCFKGPWEEEPNNPYDKANGPLCSGREYYGYPNDARDFFSIDLYAGGQITVDLTIETGKDVCLQLRDQEGNLLDYKCESPYHIEYAGADGGRYYIIISTESGHNCDRLYILWTTFP